MSSAAALPTKLYSCLSYRDPRAAIEFLGRAFGFTPLLVVPDDTGGVTHAELAMGPEVIMLGSSKPELGVGESTRSAGAKRHGVRLRGRSRCTLRTGRRGGRDHRASPLRHSIRRTGVQRARS
jgi:hypothetical protein